MQSKIDLLFENMAEEIKKVERIEYKQQAQAQLQEEERQAQQAHIHQYPMIYENSIVIPSDQNPSNTSSIR